MKVSRTATVLALLLTFPLIAQQLTEKVDRDAIYKIKDEAFNRSEVMEIASYLTDVHGPRLTGSPQIKAAAEYVRKKLTEWELNRVNLENWGTFGRGWSNEKSSARIVSPSSFSVIAHPKAWTPGTNGPLTAEVVAAVVENEQDFAKYRGQLRGKYVLTRNMPIGQPQAEPLVRRYTDEDLQRLAMQPDPARRRGGDGFGERQNFNQKRIQFFLDEGVAGLIDPSSGDGDVLFVQSGGSRIASDPPSPLQLVMAREHYGRIWRLVAKRVPVRLEADIQNKFYDDDLTSFNIVGEIPGTDKSEELVMLGAHFDSWHAATGATDNAAGSAVVMEAVRILKAAKLSMRRTVRLALWTGEEQGLLGSRAYVTQHFADRETMQVKPEHGRLSVYFNLDNGGGAIRGVYLQSNEAVGPIFRAWMDPFQNLGMTAIAIRNTGQTDHVSYDAVGLPAFQFIQDPLDYETRTHHSNVDVYDRLQASDMMKNSAIMASFVYHAANRDQLLPRKPLPKPQK